MVRFKVTVDLDVLVRHDLLNFLKNESESRGATILCESFSLFFTEYLLKTFLNRCHAYF